jgi:hypothetical protein
MLSYRCEPAPFARDGHSRWATAGRRHLRRLAAIMKSLNNAIIGKALDGAISNFQYPLSY